MSKRRYAAAVWQVMSSSESRASVKDAVKRALETSGEPPARLAASRTRAVVRAARSILKPSGRPLEDEIAEQWFLEVTDAEIAAANDAWFKLRLPEEFEVHLAHHTELPPIARLPDDPRALHDLSAGGGPPFGIYADADAISKKRILEIGCGCGYFGKMIAPHAERYLGTDHSTAALRIARLVSPKTATYVHPTEQSSLAMHHKSVDTVIGRDLFLHHNVESARGLLGFIEPFLVLGARVYATFYWPDPERPQDDVYPAAHPLTDRPWSTFAFSHEDVERLIEHRPFRILREEMLPGIQRHFAVLEKTRDLDD